MSGPGEHYPDDILEGDFPSADLKKKREAEVVKWFDDFQRYCRDEGGIEIGISPDAAREINSLYWETMCDSVRIRLQRTQGEPVRADRHKIASLFELLIATQRPFNPPDEAATIDLNARAAFFVATNIIGNWGYVDTNDLFVSESFDREHRTWLKQLNTHSEGLPIFSNAATWYLVEKLFIERGARRQAA
ncbi:MAG: hypothetical protein U1E96_08795 [Azonexus sp.]